MSSLRIPAFHAGSINDVQSVTPTDTLAEFREQVKKEQAEKSVRQKMSEPALTKLRAIREQDKQQEIDNAKFAAGLKLVIVNETNLGLLIERCNTSIPAKQIDRRVLKLGWWIRAGYRLGEEIDSVMLINFFSELIPDEKTMSDSAFAEIVDGESATRLKASRIRRGLLKAEDRSERLVPEPVEGVDFTVTRDLNGDVFSLDYLTAADDPVWTGIPKPKEPVIRRCKAGKKCLRYEHRKAAPVAGKGEYCSRHCSESAKARAKRHETSISKVQEVAAAAQSI